ncbi:hypothetical protein FNV43_RR18261 [Rhamnella rubrinervis]|uniref:Fatty acid hydroxylase domain-containing protein n=1 Tax=Rhamnella rubrinervis TaxID=2594499 RepID=A0A8K0E4T8_9ROSA|nr:hypothetical protein FNV43_RR18261 [Rhamnella rubrinervis]
MLPYQTLQQAEEALGRALTVAEKIWFKYSANKPDYILHYHNTLFLFFFYSILPLPFIFLELYFSRQVDKYKIQPKFNRSFSDMFKCYLHVMRTFLLAVVPVQLLSYPTVKWIGIRTNLELPSGSEVFWQLLVYFVIEDFSHYWLHRMLHSKWAYEKIHHVHHQYTAPIGLSAPYAH